MVSMPKEGQQSRRITSYWSRTVFRYSRSIVSRLMMSTNVTSMAARSMLAGSRSTPSSWWKMPSLGRRGLSSMILPNTVARVSSNWSGCW